MSQQSHDDAARLCRGISIGLWIEMVAVGSIFAALRVIDLLKAFGVM